MLARAILLGVERYIRNVAEDLRDFHDGIITSVKRLHDNGDTTYKEVKRMRKEQEEWQDAASKATSAMKATVDRQAVVLISEPRAWGPAHRARASFIEGLARISLRGLPLGQIWCRCSRRPLSWPPFPQIMGSGSSIRNFFLSFLPFYTQNHVFRRRNGRFRLFR
jgi:hypothetical protein